MTNCRGPHTSCPVCELMESSSLHRPSCQLTCRSDSFLIQTVVVVQFGGEVWGLLPICIRSGLTPGICHFGLVCLCALDGMARLCKYTLYFLIQMQYKHSNTYTE